MNLAWPLSVPVLTDGEITLRAHTPADVDALFEMGSDPLMQRFTTVPTPYEHHHAEEFVSQFMPKAWAEGNREWAIDAPDDDGHPRFAGNVGLRGEKVAELAFALHPWARGRGVMTAAAELAIQWGFTDNDCESVYWRATTGNLGSLRVAHALGFSLDATLPSADLRHGKLIDLWWGHRDFGATPVPGKPWAESVINGDGIRLRPVREDDAARIAEARNDPDARQWLNITGRPHSVEHGLKFVHRCWFDAASRRAATWAITTPGTDEYLGDICLTYPDGDGEIGYLMHPEARGKGSMKRALAAVVGYAFASDGLDRSVLTVQAATGNAASNAVIASAGFELVGTRTSAEPLGDGSFADLNVYELIRT